MGFNKEQAEYALSKTETVDGLRFSGNNHKIGQLLSLHGHLKDSMERLTLLENEKKIALDKANELANENRQLRSKVYGTEFEESLGAAIENAAGSLPQGYVVKIEVENGGYSVELLNGDPENPSEFEGESIVDEIEQAVAFAIDMTQP